MSYENLIIFRKFVRSDSKEKFYYIENIIKSIIFRKFQIFFMNNNIFASTKQNW